ncbi:uncharacterized protein LOC110034880 [Phalaenopsis equestris]|uniref:uncharacterized protein LOC110034880 n=1 Tax=Phalaenopsis equestris TaxID=78828 RepID=UPI0009E51999|nr:uncharacterized protein LOC110034880 [Phalaenopsis equestris]
MSVHMRFIQHTDFKRRLSELRGREIPESFAWSYKRKYKTGYIWQDVTDEDDLIPTTNHEYVLKGSIKITQKIKEEKEAKPVTEMNKESSIQTLASTSSSRSQKADGRTEVFKVDAWREDIKRLKKQKNEEIIMENEMKFRGVGRKKGDGNGGCKWGSIMSNLLNCRTVEMRDSVIRVAGNQSRRRSNNNNIN